MTQHCTLTNVWLTWLGVPLLALAAGFYGGWTAALAVVAAVVIVELLYLRFFPLLSRTLGYGSVADEGTAPAGPEVADRVTLYTANVCPFCPLTRKRLQALQQELGFELEEVDVTFRPGLVREKGFKSVPVVEVGGRQLRGNATTGQLAEFLRAGGSNG